MHVFDYAGLGLNKERLIPGENKKNRMKEK